MMLNDMKRRGFAIPTALMVISVLTIMVAGGFSLVSAERRSVADQKSQISAFRIAEQGLELYLISRDSMRLAGSLRCNPTPCTKIPQASDSVQVTLPGGYAQVSLTRLRPVNNNQSGLSFFAMPERPP
jgi:Tfp pilus assembly protein PilX